MESLYLNRFTVYLSSRVNGEIFFNSPTSSARVIGAEDWKACADSIEFPTLQPEYHFDRDDTDPFEIDIAYGDCGGLDTSTIINTNEGTERCST